MAAPKHRRQGFSKKAQYSIFASYLLAILGALIGLLLLAISIIDPRGFAALRTMGAEITAPVSRALSEMNSSADSVGSEISAYFNAASKNAQMERDLAAARIKILEAKALKQENARLKDLLKLTEETPEIITKARIISSSASSWRRLATLGAGRKQGIESGQPVKAASGLIGRILEVGPTTARVLLTSDQENVTPVKRASDGEPALARGLGNGMVEIQTISGGGSEILKNDLFVTSGKGGLYEPNVPVAVVVKITPEKVQARLLANPSKTEYVLVSSVFLPELVEAAAETDSDDQAQATEDD